MKDNLDRFVEELQDEILEQARSQYSETVIEHWQHPRNPVVMQRPDGHGRIEGPCGDTMEIFLRVEGERIAEASFVTDGCITSIASGSMAVELATGQTISRAAAISQQAILDALGGLPEESEHCAELASGTLRAAVDDYLGSRGEPWKRMYERGK